MPEIKIEAVPYEEICEYDYEVWPKEDIDHFGKKVGPLWIAEDYSFRAVCDENIIGSAHGRLEAGVIYLKTLIVSKEFRKKGVGKMLIDEIINWAKPLSAHKMYLFTAPDWDSCRFYEKLGFTQSGILPNHYLKKDFVIYSKDLEYNG